MIPFLWAHLTGVALLLRLVCLALPEQAGGENHSALGSHCGGVQGDMKRDVARLCRKSDVREPLILMDDGGEGLTEKVENG